MIKIYLGIALIALAFFAGWKGHSYYQDSKDLAATQKAISEAVAKARAEEKIKHDAALKLAREQQKTKTVFKTVTKEVTKYVTKNIIAQRECLDHTGLMLWNAASAGTPAPGASTRGIDATVPRFVAAAGRSDWWRYAGQSHGSSGDLSRLQKSSQLPDPFTVGDR